MDCQICRQYIDDHHDELVRKLAHASLKFDITMGDALLIYMESHHELGHPSEHERQQIAVRALGKALGDLLDLFPKADTREPGA